MANCASDYSFANQEQCFIVLEDICGVLKKPTPTSVVYTVGPADIQQEREKLKDDQVRAGASEHASIKGRLQPGPWSLGTYIKPSGILGTPCEEDVLLQCLMGLKTITPNTKVMYNLTDQLDSFSIWLKKGHTVFAMRGCTVDKADFSIGADKMVEVKWSGLGMERLYAGTATVSGVAALGATTLTLVATGALRYQPGTYVVVGADDNAGAGYLIKSVNYTLNTITLDTALAVGAGSGATVSPWLPTPAAEVGTPVHGKIGLVTIGGQNAIVLSADFSISNNIKYYDNLKNGVWTAESFARPGRRAVTGKFQMHFLQSALSYYYRSDYFITNAIVIPAGDESGKIMEISVPYAEYGSPKLSGTEEFLVDVDFKGISPTVAGNDEAVITLK